MPITPGINETVLDTFDGTGALSANWTKIDVSAGSMTRVSGVANGAGASQTNGAYWSGDTFSADQCAWMELGTDIPDLGVMVRAGDYTNRDGYEAYTLSTSSIRLARITADTATTLETITPSQTLAAGDKIALVVIGTKLEVWCDYGSGWVQEDDDAQTDATYSSGDIAIVSWSNTGDIDSFGGGNLVPSVEASGAVASATSGTTVVPVLPSHQADDILVVEAAYNAGANLTIAPGDSPGDVVQDSFTGTGALGSLWETSAITTASTTLATQGGGSMVNGDDTGTDSAYTTSAASPSSADCYAWGRLAGTANYQGIYIRGQQGGGSATQDGYFLEYDTDADTLMIKEVTNGSLTTKDTATSIVLSTGDRIGITCEGTTIKSWIDTGSGWVEAGSVTDSTHSAAGWVGAWLYTTDEFSEMGWGNLGDLDQLTWGTMVAADNDSNLSTAWWWARATTGADPTYLGSERIDLADTSESGTLNIPPNTTRVVIFAGWYESGLPDPDGVASFTLTVGGSSMSAISGSASQLVRSRLEGFELADPGTGSVAWTCTVGGDATDSGAGSLSVFYVTGCGAVRNADANEDYAVTSQTATPSTVSGDLVLSAALSQYSYTWTMSQGTEVHDAAVTGGGRHAAGYLTADGASEAIQWTQTSAGDIHAVGVSFVPAGVESNPTVTSSVAATSTVGLFARAQVIRNCATSGTPFEDATTAGTPSSDTTPFGAAVTTTGVNRLVWCSCVVDEALTWSTAPPPSPINETVLDAFDGTGALSANWTGTLFSGDDTPVRTSGELTQTDTTGLASAYWNTIAPSADWSVWAEYNRGVSETNGDLTIMVRAQSPGTSGLDGYALSFEDLENKIYFERIDNGSATALASTPYSVSQFADGDKLGLVAVGTTIIAYTDTGSGWVELGRATDTTYQSAGYIGVRVQNDGRAKSFGGGNLTFWVLVDDDKASI